MGPSQRNYINRGVILVLGMAWVGCGEQKADEPRKNSADVTPGGVLFSPGDFRYNPKVPAATSDDANARMIESAEFLFLTMPTPTRGVPGENQVRSLHMQSSSRNCAMKSDKTRYVANGNYLALDIVQDNSLCAEFDPSVHTHKILYAHYELSCANTDLSVLAGESAAAIAATGLCPTDSEFGQMTQMKLVASKGGAQIIISLGYMTSENGICKTQLNGDRVTAGPCGQYYSVIQSNGSVKYLTHVDRFEAGVRTGVVGEYFYRSGEVDFQINQWNGALNYRESLSATGSADLPTFMMTSATGTIKGVYPPQLEDPTEQETPEAPEEEAPEEETPTEG